MKKATITEAKNQLSALVARVRHGETIVITDRGRPVALLVGVSVSQSDFYVGGVSAGSAVVVGR